MRELCCKTLIKSGGGLRIEALGQTNSIDLHVEAAFPSAFFDEAIDPRNLLLHASIICHQYMSCDFLFAV